MKPEMRQIILRQLDKHVSDFNKLQRLVPRPARGWLRAVRQALGLSQSAIAPKLEITRSGWNRLEDLEAREGITLATLRRAAAALGCDLVYGLAPRAAIAETFADLANSNDPVMDHLLAAEHSMALEGQAVGDLQTKRKL